MTSTEEIVELKSSQDFRVPAFAVSPELRSSLNIMASPNYKHFYFSLSCEVVGFAAGSGKDGDEKTQSTSPRVYNISLMSVLCGKGYRGLEPQGMSARCGHQSISIDQKDFVLLLLFSKKKEVCRSHTLQRAGSINRKHG